jgi:hypothetical protein
MALHVDVRCAHSSLLSGMASYFGRRDTSAQPELTVRTSRHTHWDMISAGLLGSCDSLGVAHWVLAMLHQSLFWQVPAAPMFT